MSAATATKSTNAKQSVDLFAHQNTDLLNGTESDHERITRWAQRAKVHFENNTLDKPPSEKYRIAPNRARSPVSDDAHPVVLPAAAAFQCTIVGRRSVHTLQEWEGYVSAINKDAFEAILSDITDPDREQEHASIPIASLDKEESKHLKLGAIFRFIVGFAVTDRGNRVNERVIYFRRYIPSKIDPSSRLADLIRENR